MKTTKRNIKRLLNVAKACRETIDPNAFTMKDWGYDGKMSIANQKHTLNLDAINNRIPKCGTPACALGNYAARPDLQKRFRLAGKRSDRPGALVLMNNHEVGLPDTYLEPSENHPILEHFGLEYGEAMELFEYFGCGNAKTHIEAAEYIENFVKRETQE